MFSFDKSRRKKRTRKRKTTTKMMTMKKDENNEFSGPSSLTHFGPVQDTDRERGGTRALF